MINALVIDAIMTGMAIGLSYIPLWYMAAYVADKIWDAFRPEVRLK